jgi:hypothetical protein
VACLACEQPRRTKLIAPLLLNCSNTSQSISVTNQLSLYTTSRQLPQSIPLHHHLQPLIHRLSPDLLIELDTGLIPLEHTPLESPPVGLEDLGSQEPEEEKPVAIPPGFGLDIEVFEVDAGGGAPGGVVVEEEGHAYGDWRAVCGRRRGGD